MFIESRAINERCKETILKMSLRTLGNAKIFFAHILWDGYKQAANTVCIHLFLCRFIVVMGFVALTKVRMPLM